jgi:hypothetical protein
VNTGCGAYNPDNPGAYGNVFPTDDIPAVEVNVVGGDLQTLYPGDSPVPLQYAITNPGPSPVTVISVTASVDSSGGNVENASAALAPVSGCLANWYQVNNSPQTLNGVTGISIPPGTTLFTTSPEYISTLSVQMLEGTDNVPTNQVDCEGVNVGLTFSSN